MRFWNSFVHNQPRNPYFYKKALMKAFHLFLFALLSSALGLAQQEISGTVSNNRNKPIEGALIYLDTINSGVQTNADGFYKVMVDGSVKAVHAYSSKYGLLSPVYNGEKSIDFVYLEGKLPSRERINENSVSIGYDEVANKYYASKVENVEADERIDAVRFLTIYDLIRDRLPGVRVTSDNRIIIRGVSSFVSSQDPLFVVDGQIVSSIDYILPVDVKDISVLKGAEASIYGARAANGVILIKTRKK